MASYDPAISGNIDSGGNFSESLEKLRIQFNNFFGYRKHLKESFERISCCFQLLEDDIDQCSMKSLFTEGTGAIEGILEKDPIIMIGGQLNCGKSSFINLLLNRRVVPVNEHPCTARIVRIKYSQDEYYQLTDATGHTKGPRCPLDRKTLWKEIELDEGRERRATVDEMVEIGLNSPLLESGLQIIDTPGLSENDALDSVVTQRLDGVLQVLFYIIDGNTSWRSQDAEFISRILMQSPDMKIIYICNKCEEDERAAAFDSSGGDTDTEEGMSPIPKGQIVYWKLWKSGLLSKGDDITCNRYFQISCAKLRQRRRDAVVPLLFCQEYQRLIRTFCVTLRHFLYHTLQRAVGQLLGIVMRCLNYCRKHERHPMGNMVPSFLDYFEEIHYELVTVVAEYKDQLKEAVTDVLMKKRIGITEESNARLKDIGRDVGKKKNFYIILVGLSNLAAEIGTDDTVRLILKTIVSNVNKIATTFLQTSEELKTHGNILNILQGFADFLQDSDIESGFTNFVKNYMLKTISQLLETVEKRAARHQPVTYSVEKSLGLFDAAEFVNALCTKISEELSEIGDSLRINCKMAEFMNRFEENSAFSKKVRQSFAAESMGLMSLLSTIQHKEVIIPGLIGQGKRCKVHRGKRECMVLAARSTILGESSQDFREMAKTYTMFRDLSNKDHLNILKPFDVGRDSTGQVLVLVPYIEKNLFQELCDGTMLQCEPEERLCVGLQIVKGCTYLKEMGLEAVDLRPNNIRLQDGCPKIDISKWRGLTIPYPAPDNKSPFHFPPECIRGDQNRYPSAVDSYGCAILIWMLACGRFFRPPFADEENPASERPNPKFLPTTEFATASYSQVSLTKKIKRPTNPFRVQRELEEILGLRGGVGPLLPLVKVVLEKCITDEPERVDIMELYQMLQSQMAVLI